VSDFDKLYERARAELVRRGADAWGGSETAQKIGTIVMGHLAMYGGGPITLTIQLPAVLADDQNGVQYGDGGTVEVDEPRYVPAVDGQTGDEDPQPYELPDLPRPAEARAVSWETLNELTKVLLNVERFLTGRDEMNAAVHVQHVRLSPLTKDVIRMRAAVFGLFPYSSDSPERREEPLEPKPADIPSY
jgi:hypothetical protein